MRKDRNIDLLYSVSTNSLSQNAGLLINALRKNKKISGDVLAGFIGISQQQISRYERGETELTLEKIKQFSTFFDISVWEFMDMLYLFYAGKSDALHEIDNIVQTEYYLVHLMGYPPIKKHKNHLFIFLLA